MSESILGSWKKVHLLEPHAQAAKGPACGDAADSVLTDEGVLIPSDPLLVRSESLEMAFRLCAIPYRAVATILDVSASCGRDIAGRRGIVVGVDGRSWQETTQVKR